jgi:hypothetical protein
VEYAENVGRGGAVKVRIVFPKSLRLFQAL